MEQSTWSTQQITALEALTQDFTSKQINKYHIHWLKRLIRKTDSYQEECTTCKELCGSFDALLVELENIKANPKYNSPNYFTQLNNYYDHLKKNHKIVEQKYYMNRGIIIGVLVGMAASYILKYAMPDYMQYGLYGAVLAGFVIGLQLDKKAISEDRVL